MTSDIRVGVIGCGKIATCSHVPKLTSSPGASVTALFDTDRQKMESLRQELAPDAEPFEDYDGLLASGLVDAVTICTPNRFHHPQTIAALQAGLHVLCEKPMAGDLEAATEMVDCARAQDRVLHINQSGRYSPLYTKVAELVHNGSIGEPKHVRCIRAGGNTPDCGWSPGATWFVQKSFQGGVVLDIGIHMADLLRWLMGAVDRIAALVDTWKEGIDVPDNVSALFRFKSGATGILELSWTLPSGAGLLEVYGSEGSIRTGFGAAKPIELTQRVDGELRTAEHEAATNVPNSFENFVAAARGEAPSLTPGEYGRRALALCDTITRSAEAGVFLDVPRFE